MLPKFLTTTSTTKSGRQVTNLNWWVTLLFSIALSVGTWNPSGIHFISYLSANIDSLFDGFRPFYILMMMALWILAVKSIFQSLKFYGALITVIILGAFVWGLEQNGLIDIKDLKQLGWATTIGMGILIWFGMNASIMWKRLTGIYTTDHTDEG